ncbi:MAG: hypothetical protein CL917_14550 [Deltaproteobacteria bacterium]|nr:hypothetical protein [Deltaproteobacteria bacterium]
MRTIVRSTTLSLLLALGLLVFGAASASAFSTSMTNSWGGGVASVGDTLTVTVSFDTDGAGDVSLLSVSVLFDDAIMSYDGGTSATYALYTGGKGATYLKPATTNNTLRVGTSNQILMDWQNNILPGGAAASGNFQMSVLSFTVQALGDGQADFTISADSPGNTLFLGDETFATNNVSGSFAVITPEPTTALLVGMGLVGLGVAGRRRE